MGGAGRLGFAYTCFEGRSQQKQWEEDCGMVTLLFLKRLTNKICACLLALLLISNAECKIRADRERGALLCSPNSNGLAHLSVVLLEVSCREIQAPLITQIPSREHTFNMFVADKLGYTDAQGRRLQTETALTAHLSATRHIHNSF